MTLRMNSELPVSNRTVHAAEVAHKQRMHKQRLADIATSSKRREQLGNSWRQGPNKSMPWYPHLTENLKRQQVESEKFDAIERENRLLLEKMSALTMPASLHDPTEGTYEFRPGVRLNRFMMPVIDHGISTQPTMPQRGTAREACLLYTSPSPRDS